MSDATGCACENCVCYPDTTADPWTGDAFPEMKPSLAKRLLLSDEF